MVISQHPRRSALYVILLLGSVSVAGCQGSSPQNAEVQTLSREQLLDPQMCGSCHAQHFAQWQQSPHAAASNDPVFLAMNKQGQRLTGGKLGSFCVNCHAPLAVKDGLTQDGLNLPSLPKHYQGVTCYTCHTSEKVIADHNNGIVLSGGTTLKGPISNPIPNEVHGSAYSPLLDRNTLNSSSMCGSCHDVVTPAGGVLETTYAEWRGSAFNHNVTGSSCGSCHMTQSTTMAPIADVAGAPPRLSHAHTFVGVDTPLLGAAAVGDDSSPIWAQDTNQALADTQAFLDTSLQTAVCVRQVGDQAALRVILDNVASGHTFPSGAVHDRRLWVELIAYQGNQVIYQTGVVAEGNSVTAEPDPDLWLMRHCMFDANGQATQRFWEAAGTDGMVLPVLQTFNNRDPNFYKSHIVQKFPRAQSTTFSGMPDRVTMRVLLEPFDHATLDELVAGGDLDPNVLPRIPRFALGKPQMVEWTAKTANTSYQENGVTISCITPNNLNLQGQLTPAPASGRCIP